MGWIALVKRFYYLPNTFCETSANKTFFGVILFSNVFFDFLHKRI